MRRWACPGGGEVTKEVERRILDFGVSDTFNEAAQRWEVHYGWTISENLVRRVVERVGRKQEECEPEVLQEELQPVPRQAPALVVLGTDGSMIPTRGEDSWREAKVAVVSRKEVVEAGREGPSVREQARYVAVVGTPEELKGELAAALKAHGANEARRVVCLGDGAAWVWKLAEQLCPQAIQVLDWRHAQHYERISVSSSLAGRSSGGGTAGVLPKYALRGGMREGALWRRRRLSWRLARHGREDAVAGRDGDAPARVGGVPLPVRHGQGERGYCGAQALLQQQCATNAIRHLPRGRPARGQWHCGKRSPPCSPAAHETRRAALGTPASPPHGAPTRGLPYCWPERLSWRHLCGSRSLGCCCLLNLIVHPLAGRPRRTAVSPDDRSGTSPWPATPPIFRRASGR